MSTDFNKAFVLVSLIEKIRETQGWKALYAEAVKELAKMNDEILKAEKEEAEKAAKEPDLWSKDDDKDKIKSPPPPKHDNGEPISRRL